MKNTLLQVALFFIALVFCSSCVNETADPPGCIPLPLSEGFGWYYCNLDGRALLSPSFNPENNDEIVFIEIDINSNAKRIVRYNLVTEKRDEVFEGNVYPPVKFGQDNCLLFVMDIGYIYKYYIDKNILTQLSFNKWCSWPGWSFDYKTIYYQQEHFYDQPDGTPGQTSIGIQADLDGNILDSIFEWSLGGHSIYENCAAFIYNDLLFIVDLDTKERTEIYTWDRETGLGMAIIWIDEQTIVWSKDDGIFKTNINTKKNECIRPSCNAIIYGMGDYSKERDKLIWLKVDCFFEAGTVYARNYFVMMDTDGTNEEEILIP